MKSITAEQMIAYLQERMNRVKEMERKGYPEELIVKAIDEMISCKEMVETLICEPVNLQQDGRVTVGF